MGDRPRAGNGRASETTSAEPPAAPGSSGSEMARGLSQASWGLAVAFGFVGIVLLGWLVGRGIDALADIEPVGQVVGAVAGWIGGVFVVYWASQRGQG